MCHSYKEHTLFLALSKIIFKLTSIQLGLEWWSNFQNLSCVGVHWNGPFVFYIRTFLHQISKVPKLFPFECRFAYKNSDYQKRMFFLDWYEEMKNTSVILSKHIFLQNVVYQYTRLWKKSYTMWFKSFCCCLTTCLDKRRARLK